MHKLISSILLLFCSYITYSQYENGSIDLGLGAAVSVGLQEEIGFDIRLQYTSGNKITSYITEYNRYFIKELEHTEVYNEFGLIYNVRFLEWNAYSITGGLGYIINDYKILKGAKNTSNLFFSTAKFNHGVSIKFRGLYAITTPINLFIELNLKSFGRRYDTFGLGLTYALGI